MKKILSFTLALSVMLSAASCSGTDKKESQPKQSYTAEKMSVAAYKKETLPLPENMQMVYTVMPYNNGEDYLMLGTSTRTPEIWKVKGDFSESEIIEYPEFDVGVNYNLTATNDGTIVLFVCHADYGDLPPIPLYEYIETEEEQEKYDAAAEYSFMIKTYSPDGKLKSEVTVEDFGVVPDKSVNFKNLYSDGEIVIAEINGGFEVFDINGKYLGEFATDKGEVDCFGQDNQGNVICALKNTVNEQEILTFCKVEKDGKLTELNNTEYNFDETVYEMQATSGEYSLLLKTNSQIYGVKSDTQEIVSLFDISTSGYSTNLIEGYSVMPDGNIALMLNNSKEWKVELKKFIPRTEEEMANIKTITLGIEGNSFIEDYVTEWNDGGNDFLVEIVKYSADYEDRDAVFDQLKQDALSGNLPDIMHFNRDYAVMNDVDFASMGVLEDLYTYMDKDEIFTRDYFMPSVLNCFEYNDELLVLPNRVSLDLGTVAKTKFVGDGSDWSFEKHLDMTINPPIEREIENDSKYTRLSLGVSWSDWIDYTDGTCHFTDDSFIRYLNFCNEADVIEIEFVPKTDAEWQEYINSDEFKEEVRLDALKYIEDREIFSHESILRYGNYTEMTKGKFGGEPITVLGDITLNANDQLAITKTSENKELAWEFIKSQMTDQYYADNLNSAPFPVTKTGYKLYNDHHFYNEYTDFNDVYYNEDMRGYVGLVYHVGDELIKIGKVTEEDAAAVDKYFNMATRKHKITFKQDKMYEIFYEEIDRFFAGGCTAEECAEALQNRITIYISEQIG